MIKCEVLLAIDNKATRHKVVWGSARITPPFLTSALDGGKRAASLPGRFTSGTHSIWNWMGPRVGLTLWSREKFLAHTYKTETAIRNSGIPSFEFHGNYPLYRSCKESVPSPRTIPYWFLDEGVTTITSKPGHFWTSFVANKSTVTPLMNASRGAVSITDSYSGPQFRAS
jgi:hypothetical protein